MRPITRVSALLIGSVASVSAFAAEDKGAVLTLNLPVLEYSSATTKEKPDGGKESKETTTGTDTANLTQDGWVSATFDNVVVYMWPFARAQKVSVGYYFNDLIEAGVTVGINGLKQKESKAEETKNRFGFYVEAEPKVGPAQLELILAADHVTQKGKNLTYVYGSTAEPEKDQTGIEAALGVNALFPLAKNLSYEVGLKYSTSSFDVKKPAKEKNSDAKFGVTLAAFRLSVD